MPPSKELLASIIRMIVLKPEMVEVSFNETEHSVTAEVKVGDGDFGQVLGRSGNTASAIRKLFGIGYGKIGKSFYMHIVDPRAKDN